MKFANDKFVRSNLEQKFEKIAKRLQTKISTVQKPYVEQIYVKFNVMFDT